MTDSVGLMDLQPATRVVEIQGKTLKVRALSAAAIASMIATYPTVRKLFNGGDVSVDFTVEGFISAAPEAVAFLIASGFEQQDDPAVLAHVRSLGLSDQLALLEGVVDATLEGGFAPFVARLNRMLAGFGVGSLPDIGSLTEAPVST